MDNNNNNKSSLGSVAALFLALFFSLIVIVALFGAFHINEYDAYPAVLIFAVINMLIITMITAGGRYIAGLVGAPTYAAMCFITAIYTLAQFIYLGFRYQTETVIGYILYHMITLFLYFLIIIPVGIIGMKNKN